MGSMGPTELLIIFLIVLLLFGSKKLPELARGMGKGLREFQKASRDIQNEISRMDYEPKPKRSKPESTISSPQNPPPGKSSQADDPEKTSGGETE